MSQEAPSPFAGRLLTMRIIHASLMVGCVTFAIFSLTQPQPPRILEGHIPILSYVAVAFAVASGLMAYLLPGMMTASLRRRLTERLPTETSDVENTEEMWWNHYQTRLIISAALLEGVVFLALLAFLLEGRTQVLWIAGIFLLLLASLF